jgi:hypothetical protein
VRRGRAITAAACALGLLAAGATGAGSPAQASTHAAAPPPQAVTVSVSTQQVSAPRPDSFVGLAFTYREIPEWFPVNAPTDHVMPSLIHNLTPVGRPSLRIGGESADRAWWPIKGEKRPLGIVYDLGPAWAQSALALAHATNPRLLLGLELEADQPPIDAVEARQLLQRLGQRYIESFQIGNEPDLYTLIPWYKRLNGKPVPWFSKKGTPVYARAQPYTPQDYVAEVEAVLKVIPKYAISGPETNISTWMQAFAPLLRPTGPVTTLTSHAYGVDACPSDHNPLTVATIPNLLSVNASHRDVLPSETGIPLAHSSGNRFRIDELGGVTCGGPPRVSESMATALWAVDSLFYAASQGVDGVNLHDASDRTNSPFLVTRHDGHWQATVRPIYYGALMFARADPAGARLLAVSGGTPTVRVWATYGPGRVAHVTVINDSTTSGARVAVQLPANLGSTGAVQTLAAPGGASATTGVTLGGRSVSSAGTIGAPKQTSVTSTGGTFHLSVAKGSVSLLTVSAR